MKRSEVSRRTVVGVIGVGAVTAAAGAATGVLAKPARSSLARSPIGGTPRSSTGASPANDPALSLTDALVAPLKAGDKLDRWTVENLHPVENGAASVVLSDAKGQRFQLDICARDTSRAAAGPGNTEAFEICLANRGDGSTSTFEEHGLAAMALAEVIRANEHNVERTAFDTLAARVAVARVHVV